MRDIIEVTINHYVAYALLDEI